MAHENKEIDADAPLHIKFGAFRLDLQSHELFKANDKMPLPQQAVRVLEILASRPGELISRQTIQAQLWPDRHVDFEAGINTAIRKIRRALGDDAANPTIIETAPKRGYRFLLKTETTTLPVNSGNLFRRPIGFVGAAAAASFVLILLAGLFALRSSNETLSVSASAESSAINSPGYEAFLFGSHAMKNGAYKKAQSHFQDAIKADEQLAAAYVGLAHATVFNRGDNFSKIGEAQKTLDKALEIDPTLPAARHLNARLALYYWRDHKLARQEVQQSLGLAPNDPDVLTTAAYFYTIMGDSEAALQTISRAHKITPLSPSLNADYGWVHYKARNWDQAERLCKTSVDLNPKSFFALECVIHINHSQGDYAEAAEYGMRLMNLGGATKEEIAAVRAIADPKIRERAFWTWVVSTFENPRRSHHRAKLAIALSMLGRLDEAATALDRAFLANGEPFLSFVAVDPRMDEMRNHEEFQRFAALSRTPAVIEK